MFAAVGDAFVGVIFSGIVATLCMVEAVPFTGFVVERSDDSKECARCRSRLEGSSLSLRLSCRLKGEAELSPPALKDA